MTIAPRLPRVVVEDGKVRLTMSAPGEEPASPGAAT
jgi:hypothetical protein